MTQINLKDPDFVVFAILGDYPNGYRTYHVYTYSVRAEAQERAIALCKNKPDCVLAYVMEVEYDDVKNPSHSIVFQTS